MRELQRHAQELAGLVAVMGGAAVAYWALSMLVGGIVARRRGVRLRPFALGLGSGLSTLAILVPSLEILAFAVRGQAQAAGLLFAYRAIFVAGLVATYALGLWVAHRTASHGRRAALTLLGYVVLTWPIVELANACFTGEALLLMWTSC